MNILISILLIVHGLIVAAQSPSSFFPTGGVQNPQWLQWWPASLGQSWLFSWLGIEHSLFARSTGIIWLIGGMAFVAAGLSLFGIIIPKEMWHVLAITGAIISLTMLAFYLHPFYIIGISASVAILAALVWSVGPKLA